MLRQTVVEEGIVRGIQAADPRITAYKGIPFASPPIGDLRFHPPVPMKKWDGVRNCFDFANTPMQPAHGLDEQSIYCREWSVDPELPMGEDCLYLNVWTPAKKVDERMPVYFWIYGGAFQVGSTAEMEFDGERIARRGIVVVTINYRVNLFGFLCHPEITAENPNTPANFGLLDQQFALRWVKRNIAAFGGDPENITIGGQSAGGGSVIHQLCNLDNKGYFKRAIIQSGMLANCYKKIFPERTLSEAEQVGVSFFDFMNVHSLEEARKLSTEYIWQKWAEWGGFFKSVNSWIPLVDGHFSKKSLFQAVSDNEIVDVPIMFGHTTDEFVFTPEINEKEQIKDVAANVFPGQEQEFLKTAGYPNASVDEMNKNCAIRVVEYANRRFQMLKDENNKSTNTQDYYYTFDVPIPGWDNPGTFHSVDLWFTFETLAKCWRPFTGVHYDIARKICGYWCNFIKTGDPNGEDSAGEKLPEWKPFTTEHSNTMIFSKEAKLVITEPSTIVKLFLEKK